MKLKKILLLCGIAGLVLVILGVSIFLLTRESGGVKPDDSSAATTTGMDENQNASTGTNTNPEGDESTSDQEIADTQDTPDSDGQEPADSESPDTLSPDSTNADSEPETEEPSGTVTEAPSAGSITLSFEAYYAMSAAEQEAHYNSFASPAEFFVWYNAAKDKYLEENPGVEIGPNGIIP